MTFYPIIGLEYHKAELEKLDVNPAEIPSVEVLWHVNAIAALEYGAFHELDGPGTEKNGKPLAVESYLVPAIRLGPHGKGRTILRTIPKETPSDD